MRTYGALLRASVSKVAAKVGSHDLLFLGLFASAAMVVPKSPSPVFGRVVRHPLELREAAVFWYLVRGGRAIADFEWSPRVRAIRQAVRLRVSTCPARAPPCFSGDMWYLSTCTASGDSILRSALKTGELADSKDGLGAFLGQSDAVRNAASTAIAFFGVQRSSEGVQPLPDDLTVDLKEALVNIKVVRQKNDQAGTGQLARLVAVPAWVDACPVRIIT